MKKLIIITILMIVVLRACAQLPTVVIPDGTSPAAFLDSMENILNRQNDSIDYAIDIGDLNYGFILSLRDSVDSLRYDLENIPATGGSGGGTEYLAGSGLSKTDSTFNLGDTLTMETKLLIQNYLFEIGTLPGTGSNSRRIQMDTGEGLYLEYDETNTRGGDQAAISIGGSTSNSITLGVYESVSTDGTVVTYANDSMKISSDSLLIDAPVSFLDSMYLKYSTIPWDTLIYVGADPVTHALYLDTTENTSFGLTMPIEPIQEFMQDVVNGELKWYYKHGDEIVFARGWMASPGDRQEQVGVMIERVLRYAYENDVKIRILEASLLTHRIFNFVLMGAFFALLIGLYFKLK